MQLSAEWKRICSKTQTHTLHLDWLSQLGETTLLKRKCSLWKSSRFQLSPVSVQLFKQWREMLVFFSSGCMKLAYHSWSNSRDKVDKVMIWWHFLAGIKVNLHQNNSILPLCRDTGSFDFVQLILNSLFGSDFSIKSRLELQPCRHIQLCKAPHLPGHVLGRNQKRE